jgi:hypothetical protein
VSSQRREAASVDQVRPREALPVPDRTEAARRRRRLQRHYWLLNRLFGEGNIIHAAVYTQ